jgi:hypothetical protein
MSKTWPGSLWVGRNRRTDGSRSFDKGSVGHTRYSPLKENVKTKESGSRVSSLRVGKIEIAAYVYGKRTLKGTAGRAIVGMLRLPAGLTVIFICSAFLPKLE